MKIALVCQPIAPFERPSAQSVFSLEIWNYQIAKRLSRNYEVVVYGKSRLWPHNEWEDDVQYRMLPAGLDSLIAKVLGTVFRGPRSNRPLFALSVFYGFFSLLVALDMRIKKIDVVHLQNFSQMAPIIRWLNPHVRIILDMQSEWLTQLDPQLVIPRLRTVDAITACSDYMRGTIVSRFPQLSSISHTLYNGVATNSYGKSKSSRARSDGRKRLLYIGRVSPEKGLHVLMEALDQVLTYHPKTEVHIVGPINSAPPEFIAALSNEEEIRGLLSFYDADYLHTLKNLIPAHAVEKVHFLGPVPHSELPAYYRRADIFVFPSIWNEGLGIPPLEAGFFEVPVVASRSGGLSEAVLDGQTGFLVERGRAAPLAQAIIKLLDDPASRLRLGRNARKRVLQMFSWDHIAEEFSKIINHHAAIGEALNPPEPSNYLPSKT